jgi:hypothetical protein
MNGRAEQLRLVETLLFAADEQQREGVVEYNCDAYDLTGSYIRGGAGSVVAVTTFELGPSVPLLRMTVTL